MSELKDPALPPATPDLKMASMDIIMPGGPESFHTIDELPGGLVRDTDIERLSGGQIGARVIRTTQGYETHGSPWHFHKWDFQVAYISKGWGLFEFEGIGQVRVEEGSFLYQPALNRHREIETSADFEAIEITIPAKVEHTLLLHDEKTDNWEEKSFFA